MEIAPRITVDERVAFGKPVIKGTRIPVELVIGQLAGGMTYETVAARAACNARALLTPCSA